MAGERFHAALTSVNRPSILDRRSDPWAIGDRVAWGELPVSDHAGVKHLSRLASALRPVDAPSQLIHGDLTGNVLIADRLPPFLLRALIYHAVTDRLVRADEPMRPDDADPFLPAVEIACLYAGGRRSLGSAADRSTAGEKGAPPCRWFPEPIENLASQVGALSASGKASAEHTLP